MKPIMPHQVSPLRALLVIGCLWLFAAVTTIGGSETSRKYALGDRGHLTIELPTEWRETATATETTRLDLEYMPKEGMDFSVQISAFWNPPQGAQFDLDWAKAKARGAAKTLQGTTAEDQIAIVMLPQYEAAGYYYSVTDENATSDPEDYPYITQGFAALGDAGLGFTILSNEPDASPVTEALQGISGARFLPAGSPAPRGLTIREVMLDPQSASPECTPIDGEHGYSPQAHVEYALGLTADLHDVPLLDKALQSFLCGNHKGTVYYYEYPRQANMHRLRETTGQLIWGGRRPNSHHPERIFTIQNILVVVSSKKPKVLLRFFPNDDAK